MSTPVTTPAESVVRVERGHAEPEELAAITALLLARAANAGRTATGYEQPRTVAGWRRLERQSGFRPSHSWQG